MKDVDRFPFLKVIDEKKDLLSDCSDYLWEFPETAFTEFRSAAYLIDLLEKEGFTVTKNIGGISTAFSGSYGEGHPVVGILGEFDALSGLAQESNVTESRPIPGQSCGQGCGHNFFGAGSIGAALAVKRYLETSKVAGTVIFFGTPAEEGGSGKGFMARAGAFDGVDFAITWHPAAVNKIRESLSLANAQILYKFDGVAAHAGANPEDGRSALDAVELLNIGVQFLREHMSDNCRVHYAITDTGGYSPNVVQGHSEVLYLIRAPRNSELQALTERVDRIAEGAALMTETKLSRTFIKATSNTIINHTLCRVMDECARKLDLPVPTEDDIRFGRKLTENAIFSSSRDPETPFHPEIKPLTGIEEQGHGSTDVGDVSWVCPTVQMSGATWVAGTPGHSWQVVTQGKREWGKRITRFVAKAMALTAVQVMEDPALLAAAWEEHRENVGPNGYECPIPDDVVPTPLTSLLKK
ncbi:MAG: amidohydrolase [Lachnospiraceae bacterium]|nr:amidohydrolase [Lachnospiraceae bacterium]